MIMWSSNKTIRGAGWNASLYDTIGISDLSKLILTILSVFPNPTDGMLNIQFTMNETQSVKIEILSMNGETIYSQESWQF